MCWRMDSRSSTAESGSDRSAPTPLRGRPFPEAPVTSLRLDGWELLWLSSGATGRWVERWAAARWEGARSREVSWSAASCSAAWWSAASSCPATSWPATSWPATWSTGQPRRWVRENPGWSHPPPWRRARTRPRADAASRMARVGTRGDLPLLARAMPTRGPSLMTAGTPWNESMAVDRRREQPPRCCPRHPLASTTPCQARSRTGRTTGNGW